MLIVLGLMLWCLVSVLYVFSLTFLNTTNVSRHDQTKWYDYILAGPAYVIFWVLDRIKF